MAEVKIGVKGNGDNLAKSFDVITASLNRLGREVTSANKLQFEPVDVKYTQRDLALIQKQFQQALQQSKALRDALKSSGQEGRGLAQIDFSRLSVDPKAAQRMRDRAFTYSVQGTAWDLTNFDSQQAALPKKPTPAGEGGRPSRPGRAPRPAANDDDGPAPARPWRRVAPRVGQSLMQGIGGGVGQIGSQALAGASEGAASGGVLGGLTGLLGGLGIGALAFGAFKVGQAGAEGYGMAKERDLALDTLKRQMGDLGVSFEQLKTMSDAASEGLGVNSKEFAALEQQYAQESRGAERSPMELARSTQFGVGFARSYGMDPGAALGFFGGMKQIDPRQNNRELALQIADAITRSGGRALAPDVMQAMQSFAAIASRMSLSAPNTAAFAGAYSSMLNKGGAGMTSDTAASILGNANSAMIGMGGAGEAGMNFILQAFNKAGGQLLNPVAAKALAAGGLFGSRRSVFGSGTALAQYFGNDAGFKKLASGQGADVMNFDAVKQKLNSDLQDPWLRLDGAQRMFNLSSPEQAAALMNLDTRGYGSLNRVLKSAGVDIKDINGRGIQTLARIGDAKSPAELSGIYKEIRSRTGVGALTEDERKQLDGAQGGDMESFRTALVKIMASKDQEQTDASKMWDSIKSLENTQISIGDKMIGPINTMRDALLAIAGKNGKSATAGDLARRAFDAEREEINNRSAGEAASISSAAASKTGPMKQQLNLLRAQQKTDQIGRKTGAALTKGEWEKRSQEAGALEEKIRDLEAQIAAIDQKAKADIAGVNARKASSLSGVDDRESRTQIDTALNGPGMAEKRAIIAEAERKNHLPKGMLLGVFGTESSFGKNTGMSTAGAHGNFQMMDGTAKKYHVKFGDFASEAEGAARYLSDLHAERGTWKGSLFGYNGVVKNIAAGEAYVRNVQKYGGMQMPDDAEEYGYTPEKIARKSSKAQASSGTAAGSNAGAGGSANDTLNVNINMSVKADTGNGSQAEHQVSTAVSVPRGSGVQTTTLSN